VYPSHAFPFQLNLTVCAHMEEEATNEYDGYLGTPSAGIQIGLERELVALAGRSGGAGEDVAVHKLVVNRQSGWS